MAHGPARSSPPLHPEGLRCGRDPAAPGRRAYDLAGLHLTPNQRFYYKAGMRLLHRIAPFGLSLWLATTAFAVKWDANVQTLSPDLTKPYADVVFHFQNDGEEPLIVTNVISSCAACLSAQTALTSTRQSGANGP